MRGDGGAAVASELGVHLASYRAPEHAQRGWDQLHGAHRAELEGLLPLILPSQIEGRGLYYRLIAGPIPSPEDARRRCEALEASEQCFRPMHVAP